MIEFGIAADQNHQPLDIVAELAHIARPIVRLQHRHGVLADAARRQAGSHRDGLHEIAHELGHVLAPLGQARHSDRHHVEAMKQILAQATRRHLLLKVVAGGGDHAHIDMHLGSAAEPLETLLDQHAQDLGLGLERHVGDFVDIERAVMRFLQRADLARTRARPLLGAEQLKLHAVGHHGGGIQHHERTFGAGRLGVHHPGGKLLAAA